MLWSSSHPTTSLLVRLFYDSTPCASKLQTYPHYLAHINGYQPQWLQATRHLHTQICVRTQINFCLHGNPYCQTHTTLPSNLAILLCCQTWGRQMAHRQRHRWNSLTLELHLDDYALPEQHEPQSLMHVKQKTCVSYANSNFSTQQMQHKLIIKPWNVIVAKWKTTRAKKKTNSFQSFLFLNPSHLMGQEIKAGATIQQGMGTLSWVWTNRRSRASKLQHRFLD